MKKRANDPSAGLRGKIRSLFAFRGKPAARANAHAETRHRSRAHRHPLHAIAGNNGKGGNAWGRLTALFRPSYARRKTPARQKDLESVLQAVDLDELLHSAGLHPPSGEEMGEGTSVDGQEEEETAREEEEPQNPLRAIDLDKLLGDLPEYPEQVQREKQPAPAAPAVSQPAQPDRLTDHIVPAEPPATHAANDAPAPLPGTPPPPPSAIPPPPRAASSATFTDKMRKWLHALWPSSTRPPAAKALPRVKQPAAKSAMMLDTLLPDAGPAPGALTPGDGPFVRKAVDPATLAKSRPAAAAKEKEAAEHKGDETSTQQFLQKVENRENLDEQQKKLLEKQKDDLKKKEQLKQEQQKQQKEEQQKQEAGFVAPKRHTLHARENMFVGIINVIRHIGLGKERYEIIQNLGTMLNAGLPLVDSLRTLQLETRTRPGKALLKNITDRVENGIPLWRSMQEEHFFSPDALALIRIGEEAGNLAENMTYLASQQEKDQALRGKVKMAMIYPTIVLVLMFIVVIGMGMFVLPNLVGVLRSLNVPLPAVTRVVIAFSDFFATHGTVAVPLLLLGMGILAILVKFTALQAVFQWFVFRIPGIGTLLWEATIARFGVIVGGLLQAGVPVVDALRSLVEVTTIYSYRRFYARLLEHILVGDSFAKSFLVIRGSERLLPLSVQQLVMTGERTGSLSKVMLKIAEIYERKANETAQKLPVILEPLLLLFIGALVGTIAFAIIVPIYSIVGNVSR